MTWTPACTPNSIEKRAADSLSGASRMVTKSYSPRTAYRPWTCVRGMSIDCSADQKPVGIVEHPVATFRC